MAGGGAAAFSRGAAVSVRAAETVVVTDQIYVAISWSLECLCRKGSRLCKGKDVCVCKRWVERGRTEGLWASPAV